MEQEKRCGIIKKSMEKTSHGTRQMVWNKSNGVEQDKWRGTRRKVWNKTNGVEQDK